MDFTIPADIQRKLAELDAFIEREIKPLEREHMQFFDHRREYARTDWENGGRPRREWEELLGEMRRRADAAGHLRYALPEGRSAARTASNLAMAIVREHLAAQGPRPAQRPAERVVDRRQLSHRAHDAWRSARRSRRRSSCPGMITGTHRARLRPHRAGPRQRRDLARDDGGARRRRLGDQRREALQLRPAPRHLRHDLRAHRRASRATPRASPASSCRRRRRGSRSTSCGGPSTCRATTPR